jgi:hypothetical protein
MLRNDTAIRCAEQDQLPSGHGTISQHLQPVVRRMTKPKQRDGPNTGLHLNNTNSVNDNINHAASRAIDSEWL